MIRFLFGVITGLVVGILLFGTLLESYERDEDASADPADEDTPSSAVV